MSYEQAAKIFDDIKGHINAQANPIEWDVSSGLSELAHTLSQDMAQIKGAIAHIEDILRRQRQ